MKHRPEGGARVRSGLLLAFPLCLFGAASAQAVVQPRSPSALDPLAFRHPDLYIRQYAKPVDQLPAALALPLRAELGLLGSQFGFLDLRTDRWGTLLPSRPLIPGSGVGNRLTWSALGIAPPADEKSQKLAAWTSFRQYLTEFQPQLEIPLDELDPAPGIAVHEAGRIVQIHAPRALLGVPVRDSYLKATLNGGNLVLLGTRNWAPIAISTQPAVSAQQAAAAVQSYVGGNRIARVWREPRLVIVPLEQGDDPEQVPIGQGLRFRLVWEISPGFDGDRGSWEALVDAQTAELLAFSDQNLYDRRKVTGGIYPVSNDGQEPDGVEQPGYPMPFADVIQPFGTSTVTNSAGLVDGIGSTLRTSLSGPFIRMNDSCGPINEVAQCSDLDLAFGPGTDCVVPPGHSPGDTHASRSGFYELNRQTEAARALLPGNLWLQEQLTSNMNIDDTCNAFWDGQTINFFKSGGGCGNTGEIAAVFDHEWGHGLDDNDTDGAISSPGESIADIYGILRVTDSCFGRGFVIGETACAGGGYGDPCVNCSGVRDLDFARHASGLPHDIEWILSPTVSPGIPGVRPAGGCVGVAGLQQGPCGQETHCEGMVAAEAGWDLFARDLRSAPFNFDFNTALQITTRNVYLGAGNIGSWYQCVPAAAPNTSVAGCNADGGYLNLLAVDDDNGNLTDGTPHMTAIFGAFNRHQIACVPPVGPAVQNGGCADGPSAAPVLTVTASGNAAQLSWNAVGGAEKYLVFRTEGVKGCDFGKVQIAETTATQYTDSSGLLDGFTYFYSVMPVGSSASCQGRMSACASVTVAPKPSEALAALAFHEVPNAFSILTGDGDDFLDNCEIGQFSFQVENAGTVDLQNVQLVRVTPISNHPATEILTPLPSLLAATLTGGACGSPQSTAPATFRFVPQGLSPDDTLEFEFEVQGTSPSGPISLVGRIQRTGTESDFQFMASKTFTFETGLDGWKIVNGTYTRQSPGANATLFHLASSSLEEGQCDQIRSPEIRLRTSSTLSLFNQFSTEPATPLGAYDRANVGIFDSEVGSRTTVSPDGGRLYNVSGSGGVCVTQGQAGWAGAGPGFLPSSWSAAALQSGAFAGRRVRLDVTYGTDPLVQLAGFQFDEVTLTNIDLQVADTHSNSCGTPPQVVANDDSAATTLGTPVTINVVANDFTQNPPLTVVSVTDPPGGSAVNNGDGTVTYTPAPGFTGTDSFAYTVQDAGGNADSATVTVTVTGGVGPCAEPGITVLTDPSGDATSQQPAHDVQKLQVAQPSALGAEKFVFTLKMASLASPTASTTWPVVFRTPDGVERFVKMATSPQGVVSFAHGTGINPAAAGTPADPASSFSADGTIRIVVPASALGSPQAGQQLTLFLVRIRVELGPAGAITPDNMPDSLTRSGSYDVADCTVNRPPEANNDSASTQVNTAVTIDVLANDSDLDGDPLEVTAVSVPQNGDATTNGTTVTYTPDPDFIGTDSFTYTISDGQASDTATVSVTVNENCVLIDDGNRDVEYKNGWHKKTDAGASNGRYQQRAGKNTGGGSTPTARVVFDATSITYIYVKTPDAGTADVYIDGVLRETVSYASGSGSATFGHRITYSGLTLAPHEFKLVHKTGVVTVDGFEFGCAGSGPDSAAAESTSETSTSTASSGEGPIIERSVNVGSLDRDVSVVVAGSTVPVTVNLLDPSGNLIATGEALIAGLTVSGLDKPVAEPGIYKVQVVNVPGAFSTIEISIARTVQNQ